MVDAIVNVRGQTGLWAGLSRFVMLLVLIQAVRAGVGGVFLYFSRPLERVMLFSSLNTISLRAGSKPSGFCQRTHYLVAGVDPVWTVAFRICRRPDPTARSQNAATGSFAW